MRARSSENFEIEFAAAGESEPKSESPFFGYVPSELCKVTFKIKRSWQDYEVTTFVDRKRVPAEDYIKVAMHQLHLDFQRLATQTEDWKLAEDEFPEPPTNPPKGDIPF